MREFQPNDLINNRYSVLRKLGAGAMGSVYLCEDRVAKNVKVALKILVSENLEDQDVWAKGEYEALTRLRHPNLARVYNFGRIEGTNDYFIVSEFIKGLDLYAMTEFVNYAEIVEIIVQVCRALEYIHSQGYVHFDIKPDNILVTRRKTIGLQDGSKVEIDETALNSTVASRTSKPVVKLIDFGLAEKITGSFSFAIKGTLNYLAPEMLNGLNPDKRADLYSLGVTVFQIVNRDLPFYQDIAGAFGDAGGGGAPTRRSDLFEVNMKKHPEFLRDIILRLIEENPEDRFQSAKEVIQFINKNSEYDFELETEETRESYFHTSKLVGRKKEMSLLKRFHELVFFPNSGKDDGEGENEEAREDGDPSEESSEIEGTVEGEVSTPSGEEAPEPSGLDDDNDHDHDAAVPASDDKHGPHLLVLSGEMGAGKSRLLEEFRHNLKLNHLPIYAGNCYEGTQKAYEPIIEILRQVVYSIGLECETYRSYEDSLLKLLPELQQGRDDRDVEERSFRPEKEKHQFIETISQFLIEASQAVPYSIVVNNMQWIDDASVDLLDRLCKTLLDLRTCGKAAQIFVIVSQRAEEQVNDRVRYMVSDLIEEGFCREIQIRRLKTEQIREFLGALLGLTDVPEEFVERLEEQTGGSPLFLIETLKALEDAGIIKHQGGVWTIKTTRYTRVEIPQSMEDLLLKRLDHLETIKREILEVMAVFNKPVSPKMLQGFERLRDTAVLVQLRDLESVGILTKLFESNKLLFSIEQPKVREILYEALDDEKRRQYHGEVGDAFEEFYADRKEDFLEDLAYHFQRSDRVDKAIKLAVRAGDRLEAIYANEKAYEHFLFVLQQTQDEPEYLNVYFDIREKLGDICTTMGRYDVADEHYSVLLGDECRPMLAPDRVTGLYLRYGKVFEIQGDYDSALHYYKEARNHLSAFGKDHQTVDRARVYTSIGWVYVCLGKYEKAMTISLEALRVIEDRDEGMEHAKVFSTIGSANFFKGNIQEAIKYHRKSLEIKEALENIPEISVSLNNLGSAHLAGADYGEALEHFSRAVETSEQIGDPYGRAMSLHNMARLHAAIGEPDAADEFLEESFRQAKLFNMRYLNLQNHLVKGVIMRDRQDYTKAEASFFRVLTAFSKQGNRAGLCSVLVQIAEIYRLNQSFDEAASMIEEAQRYAEDLGIGPLESRCLLEKARQMRATGDENYDLALDKLRHALDLAEKGDNPELPAEIAFEMAETLVSKREVSQASQFYRTAQEKFREVLESLPAELREPYEARQRTMFRNWKSGGSSSVPRAKKAAEAGLTLGGAGSAPSDVKGTPEEALKKVNQLMMELPQAASLPQFLGKTLEDLIRLTAAECAFVLSLSGRNLSVLATRRKGGGRPANPGKLLCLPLINRALKEQHPIFVSDANEEPSSVKVFKECGLDNGSLSISPFLEPDGKKAALYMLYSDCGPNVEMEQRLLTGPFINLLPMAFLQIQSSSELTT